MAGRWVCLMYHDIGAAAPPPGGGPAFFSVGHRDFARQLDWLRQAGFTGASLRATLAHPGTRRVAITFDDGDAGQASRGFPALAAAGMTATFFVTTSWIGRPGYASWEQLRDMRAAGMDIQSHTHTHPFLSELSAAALRDELLRSRDLLGERLGQVTDMLALPGGDRPRRALRSILAEAGYRVVATSRWGTNADREREAGIRFVHRCTVRGAPPEPGFRAIAGGDPWLSTRKRVREELLGAMRASLGPSTYARWRRKVLDAVAPLRG